ncbi:MAG TPA: flagellar hook-associated protein FlgK [Magnetospirillum sp.]|nr:flagellar hook-associated protein FlgK [Magnetospirillum sp.]
MSLTLGLNTALSGLLTAQRGLDVISQNVVNVNTKGYVRKVMNPESRVLAGFGAGVQDAGVTRMVSEGLLKDIRKQLTNTGKLEVEQAYYPRIDDLFGEVSDETSIAHKVTDLFAAFNSLSGEVNKPATQWATMQSAQDVADLASSMTSDLQDLRIQSDRDLEDTVNQVNEILSNIHDLNQKIVKNSATSTGTTDLEDKRDQAVSDLSKLIGINYYFRNDNSMMIYSASGQMLLDNQPQSLVYSASTSSEPWMTAAGGQFGKVTISGSSADFGAEVTGGKLRALLDLRDTTLPNLQANLDQMCGQMRDTLNAVHNRGTSLPNVSYSYQGTRIFAKQGDIVPNPADTTAVFYKGTTGPVSPTSMAITADATNPWQATLTATGTPFDATNFAVGETFSIANAEDTRNNGTYRVVGYGGTSQITVEKVNPRQTMQIAGTGDVVIGTFDNLGNQLQKTTLNQIMQLDFTVAPNAPTPAYTATTAGTGRSLMDFQAKDDHGSWAINEVSAHVEAWLRLQGYSNASVNLDSEGKMSVNVGDTTTSLVFRDQVDSSDSAKAEDATIKFDVNGDGTGDETVKGFSNFFGLNDLYVNTTKPIILDSDVKAAGFALSSNRDLTLYDTTGQVGNTITVAKGATLQQIADAINTQTRVNESAKLNSTNWTLTSDATVTVADSNGALFSVTLTAGPHSLAELAGKLNQGPITAEMVQDGSMTRLRLTEATGKRLNVTVAGGTLSGSSMSLGETLDMTPTQRITASVIPEGSGYRLRVVSGVSEPLYTSSTDDAFGNDLASELGLERAATMSAYSLSVRSDIQTAPEKISRGTMQWNADTGKYYLSEGDNSAAMQMADAMNAKVNIESAGSIHSGKYSFAEYAAATISVVSSAANNSKTEMDYQTTLNSSLDFQNAAYSGVNLDEEIMAMMDYQQAYSASAKVISTLQDMLETLTSMIR